jgi:hypothetical protein
MATAFYVSQHVACFKDRFISGLLNFWTLFPVSSTSSSFLLGLGPVVCLYQSFSDVDGQLSRHLLGGLPGGLLVLGSWCFAQLAYLSCPILSTWSLQFRHRVLTRLATSITLHSALMSSLLIRSPKVTPFIFLKTLISADLNSCFVLEVSARVSAA